MDEKSAIQPDWLIKDILSHHPKTVSIFIQRAMGCVGCWFSDLHTVADVVAIYKLDLDGLLTQLNGCAEAQAEDK
jgi:hybrid cluster-associated redox disulfide protein